LTSPQDIVAWQAAPVVRPSVYHAGPRSVVVLYSRLTDSNLIESADDARHRF
jgi:hypothetical protein